MKKLLNIILYEINFPMLTLVVVYYFYLYLISIVSVCAKEYVT